MITEQDISNLRELIRYANPWDELRVDLRCGIDSKEMVHSAERIVKHLETVVQQQTNKKEK